MSGIVGILNVDGAPVDRDLIDRMNAFQSFRGPDRQDVRIDGPIGFGHTLAKNTDESERERQPCTLDGRLWITADARVDAREDLRSELRGRTAANLDEATDPDLILHAYDAWGEQCLQHLIGDFSFALWDAPRRRLLCAVDQFGVKPFYYARVGNAFVFSNTLDCVRMHPLVKGDLNEVAIGDFLMFGHYQDRDITVYADVARLAPGHFLVVDDGDIRRTRYWTLPEVPELRLDCEEEYVERFQDLLDKAVSDRLRTRRVGVFMSGGLDSPLVAATAKRLLARTYPDFEMGAFTVVFDHLIPDDERHFTTIAAQHLRIPVRFCPADDAGLYDWLDRPCWQPPEPVHNPTWGSGVDQTRDMAAAFPVALTGWDGDALLRGAVRTCWIDSIRQGRFARVTRDIVRCSISQRRLPPVGFRTALKRLFGRTPTPHFPTWIDPDFERRLRLRDRFREHNRPQKESSPRDATRINLGLPLWTSLLDSYDPGWTGCALDARHPLVDMRVMTFAIALPTVPWCMAKELLRRCLADMPREIRERPKTPLRGDPVTATLKNKVGVSSECLLPEMELGRFVKPGSVLVPEPGVGVSDVWSALTPLSLNCWLKGRARSRS